VSDSLLQFPCQYPLKVMGEHQPGFAEEIADLIAVYVPGFEISMLKRRYSKAANYVALSTVFFATSRDQVEALARALQANPRVKALL